MYLIITLILCTVTAAVTFIVTRSLYINHYKDWYRTAIDYQSIDDDSEESGKKMYNKLAGKYARIYNIDHTIIPEYVKRTFEWGEDDMTRLNILRVFSTARWLGYDFTLTQRPIAPPPPFKKPTPKNLKQELVECWEAEGRLEEN